MTSIEAGCCENLVEELCGLCAGAHPMSQIMRVGFGGLSGLCPFVER
jgi:hypothetical protein